MGEARHLVATGFVKYALFVVSHTRFVSGCVFVWAYIPFRCFARLLRRYPAPDGLMYLPDRILAELDKCVLLCANCHREVEAELVSKKYQVGFCSN